MRHSPQKIALVYSETPSEWVSCQSITYNLKKTYDVAMKDSVIESFDLAPSHPQLNIWECATQIHNFAPDLIAILDHKPHPRKLLETLDQLYASEKRPRLVIHLFGDFALYAKDWQLCGEILKKFEVQFICASDRQRDFVGQFFTHSSDNISVFPFPVDTEHFFFNPKIQQHPVELPPQTPLLLYTGRLSAQKNILLLLQLLHGYYVKTKANFQLALVGPMDDLGLPYFGVEFLDGHYFHLLNSFLKTTEVEFQKKVQFLGPHEPNELLLLLHQAQVFVSLSQHNDEDYGMSPAEALTCGLPCLLTDWGGYSSFKKDDSVELLPLSWNEHGHFTLGQELFNQKLTTLLKLSSEKRSLRAKLYSEHFSIKDQAKHLRDLLARPFKKFCGTGPKMEVFSALITREAPFYFGPQKYSYYQDVYAPYFKNRDHENSGSYTL